MPDTELTVEEQKFFESGGEGELDIAPDDPGDVSPTDGGKQEQAEVSPVLPEEQKLVPLAALHEARMQNKEYRESLGKAQERVAAMEARFQQVLDRLNKKPEDEKPAPSYDNDPIEYLKNENERITQELAALNKARVEQSSMAEFAEKVSAAKVEFMKNTPDYADAYEHVRNIRIHDLRDLGVPDNEISAIIRNEEIGLATTAMNAGKNPAEVLYSIAKRYGYAPKKTITEGADKKIESIAEGMKAARTIATGKPATDVTLESIAQLDDDAFTRLVEDDNWWKKAMKGA